MINAAIDFKSLEERETRRMADIDDGYTRLANELYEALIGADLTRNQAKVAHAICRKTYGYNKKVDRISDTQLGELTNLPRQKVNKAKNELIEMGVIIRDSMKIGPNKDIGSWKIVKCHQNDDTVTKTVTKSVTKTVTAVSPKQGHTKDNITKDNKYNSSSENSSEFSNAENKPKNDHSKKRKKWGSDDDIKAANWIFSLIQKLTPDAKKPNINTWSNDIRLMREIDGRTHREICELFKWANADSFWCSNVLSPAKLREKWDQLIIQRKTKKTSNCRDDLDWDNEDWADNLPEGLLR